MLQILESEDFIFSGANLWRIVRLDDRTYGYGLLKEFIGFTQIEMNCINRNYHKTLLVPTDYDIATVFTPKSHLSKLKHAHI